MPGWLKFTLQIVAFAAIILVVYNVLKKYVLSKIKASKWVILISALLVFFLPTLIIALTKNVPNQMVISYIQMPIFVILFLWFMDLMGLGTTRNIAKKNDIVIRPKAKPNRVKNNEDKKK